MKASQPNTLKKDLKDERVVLAPRGKGVERGSLGAGEGGEDVIQLVLSV